MTLDEGQIGAFIVASFRMGGLVLTAPVVGDGGVSSRAKLVLVFAVAFAIGSTRPEVSFADLPVTGLLELVVGLLTGLSAKFVVSRVAIAGQLIGLSLGLGFASQYDPHAGESAGTIRVLATTLASLAFVASGGLEAIVRGAAAAPATPSDLMAIGGHVLADGVGAFGRGVAIAAPIMLAGIIGNLGLAVMNRAAPAMNVFSVALPAVLVLGGLAMIGSSTGFAGATLDASREAIERLLGG
nr:flagellar biosynthetic protein FliR [Kofleriaceae bacterium]